MMLGNSVRKTALNRTYRSVGNLHLRGRAALMIKNKVYDDVWVRVDNRIRNNTIANIAFTLLEEK